MLSTPDEDVYPERRSPWPSSFRWYAFLAVVTLVQVMGSVIASKWGHWGGGGWRGPDGGGPPGPPNGVPHDYRPFDGGGLALALAGPLALLLAGPRPLLRRRWPVPVFAVVLATTVLFYGTGYIGPVFLSLVVAVVCLILAGHRLVGWLGAAGGLAAYYLILYLRVPDDPPSVVGVATGGVWVAAALGVAELIRIRRERAAEASRTRQEERRRRATEERLLIAQELHDVLAHNISMINVQAGVGLHLMDEKPEQARTALTAIKQASAEALGELRSVLDVLRAGAAAPRSPTPGLDGLEMLRERATAAGLDLRLTYTGDRRELPAPVELAAFRVVQESLTNVVKHARASSVDVRLDYGERVLTLTVEDDGLGKSATALPGTASGIEGMRRRVKTLGGTLTAGPRDGEGFRVHAVIPVDGS